MGILDTVFGMVHLVLGILDSDFGIWYFGYEVYFVWYFGRTQCSYHFQEKTCVLNNFSRQLGVIIPSITTK